MSVFLCMHACVCESACVRLTAWKFVAKVRERENDEQTDR